MFFDRPDSGSRAIVVHIDIDGPVNAEPERESDGAQDLAECVELARSAGLVVCTQITGHRRAPHPRFFVGTGKLDEIKDALHTHEAEVLLLDHELGAGQQRNLEAELGARVLTRTELILQIFADRAHTHEGQLQVELAQLNHAQTRLVRGWTHLDRQKGGIGLRGAGEKQIELDQRMLSERVKSVRKKLAGVVKRRSQGRRRRSRSHALSVSLVGYTNAGKSTLFNALTHADVVAEDRLFATLDPTMRKLPIPGVGEVVLADTVGFVSRLPHTLVDAFKATLEEVANADLLLHVVDATFEDLPQRINQVRQILAEIGADEVPVVLVLNKIDQMTPGVDPHPVLPGTVSVPVSAVTGEGIEALRGAIGAALGECHVQAQVSLHPGDGETRAWLYARGAVLAERVFDGRIELDVFADPRLLQQLQTRTSVVLQVNGSVPKLSSLPN